MTGEQIQRPKSDLGTYAYFYNDYCCIIVFIIITTVSIVIVFHISIVNITTAKIMMTICIAFVVSGEDTVRSWSGVGCQCIISCSLDHFCTGAPVVDTHTHTHGLLFADLKLRVEGLAISTSFRVPLGLVFSEYTHAKLTAAQLPCLRWQ